MYTTHSLHTTPEMKWLTVGAITFKTAENKWLKIGSFHTGHFLTGITSTL